MSWHREPDVERKHRCILVERLCRDDDGVILGGIMQFAVDGVVYAHFVAEGRAEHLGPRADVEEARRAVEKRLEQQA